MILLTRLREYWINRIWAWAMNLKQYDFGRASVNDILVRQSQHLMWLEQMKHEAEVRERDALAINHRLSEDVRGMCREVLSLREKVRNGKERKTKTRRKSHHLRSGRK